MINQYYPQLRAELQNRLIENKTTILTGGMIKFRLGWLINQSPSPSKTKFSEARSPRTG